MRPLCQGPSILKHVLPLLYPSFFHSPEGFPAALTLRAGPRPGWPRHAARWRRGTSTPPAACLERRAPLFGHQDMPPRSQRRRLARRPGAFFCSISELVRPPTVGSRSASLLVPLWSSALCRAPPASTCRDAVRPPVEAPKLEQAQNKSSSKQRPTRLLNGVNMGSGLKVWAHLS